MRPEKLWGGVAHPVGCGKELALLLPGSGEPWEVLSKGGAGIWGTMGGGEGLEREVGPVLGVGGGELSAVLRYPACQEEGKWS